MQFPFVLIHFLRNLARLIFVIERLAFVVSRLRFVLPGLRFVLARVRLVLARLRGPGSTENRHYVENNRAFVTTRYRVQQYTLTSRVTTN